MLNYALIPFSIAWLLRGAASAITVSLGFLWLPWMLGPVLPAWVKENVVRYLPDVAANSLSGITKAWHRAVPEPDTRHHRDRDLGSRLARHRGLRPQPA